MPKTTEKSSPQPSSLSAPNAALLSFFDVQRFDWLKNIGHSGDQIDHKTDFFDRVFSNELGGGTFNESQFRAMLAHFDPKDISPCHLIDAAEHPSFHFSSLLHYGHFEADCYLQALSKAFESRCDDHVFLMLDFDFAQELTEKILEKSAWELSKTPSDPRFIKNVISYLHEEQKRLLISLAVKFKNDGLWAEICENHSSLTQKNRLLDVLGGLLQMTDEDFNGKKKRFQHSILRQEWALSTEQERDDFLLQAQKIFNKNPKKHKLLFLILLANKIDLERVIPAKKPFLLDVANDLLSMSKADVLFFKKLLEKMKNQILGRDILDQMHDQAACKSQEEASSRPLLAT